MCSSTRIKIDYYNPTSHIITIKESTGYHIVNMCLWVYVSTKITLLSSFWVLETEDKHRTTGSNDLWAFKMCTQHNICNISITTFSCSFIYNKIIIIVPLTTTNSALSSTLMAFITTVKDAICSTTVPVEHDFTGLLTPGLYGSVEKEWPVLCTGGTVRPLN